MAQRLSENLSLIFFFIIMALGQTVDIEGCSVCGLGSNICVDVSICLVFTPD